MLIYLQEDISFPIIQFHAQYMIYHRNVFEEYRRKLLQRVDRKYYIYCTLHEYHDIPYIESIFQYIEVDS